MNTKQIIPNFRHKGIKHFILGWIAMDRRLRCVMEAVNGGIGIFRVWKADN